MTKATGHKRALVGLTATALLGLAVFAPAASAQVNVTDPIGSTTETVNETVKDVTAPVETTTGTVGDTVDKVGNTVDDTSGGTTYEKTKETVQNTTKTTTDAVQKTTGDVGDAVEETSGGIVTNPNLNVEDPLGTKKNRNNKASGGNTAGSGATRTKGAGTREGHIAAARDARRDAAANARFASVSAADRNGQPGRFTAASAIAPQRDSFMSNLAEAAGEAAKKLAFPLGLALMVGAFLMVQGRIDRKDAKLALAPIDSEQDLLSFQ